MPSTTTATAALFCLLFALPAALLPRLALGRRQLCGTPPPECARYARLLAPLARTRAEWEAAGGVTAEARDRTRAEVQDTMGAFVTIHNGNVYVESRNDGYETRLYGSLLMLQRAMARLGRHRFPDVEFGIHPDDQPKGDAFFNYCRERGTVPGNWVWPDWFFYGWPEIGSQPWPALLQRVGQVAREVPFSRRTNKLFWRGTGLTQARVDLVGKFGDRKDIADVAFVDFDRFREELERDPALNASSVFTKLEDHCRYKYIIYTEGHTWSARLKAHLICGSVIVSHPMAWESFESAILEDGKNMVLTDSEWSTLEEVYRRLEGDPALAESIAANNSELRRLLDEDGVSCYILESLKCFKDVMRFNVSRPRNDWRRSVPLEYFILAKMKPGGHLTHLGH